METSLLFNENEIKKNQRDGKDEILSILCWWTCDFITTFSCQPVFSLREWGDGERKELDGDKSGHDTTELVSIRRTQRCWCSVAGPPMSITHLLFITLSPKSGGVFPANVTYDLCVSKLFNLHAQNFDHWCDVSHHGEFSTDIVLVPNVKV